jgi:histidine triad (HIT) family protein
METIFTKIVRGEIPCYKIAENERYFAFLDINPLAEGHTLVIPRQQVDYIFDMDDDLLGGMLVFAKKIAAAIEKSVPCQRIGIAVIGLEVPHAHIHLVPLNSIYDIDFKKPKLKLQKETFEALAQRIRTNLK